MDITIERCMDILKEVAVLDFATVDAEGNPQVRNVSAVHWEPGAIYFLTARGKGFARELDEGGRVQVLGYAPAKKETVRVAGPVERVPEEEQIKWRDVIYGDYPYLEYVYPGESKDIDAIYVIRDYTVEYFCLSTKPITRHRFASGSAALKPKGYRIGGGCIGCCKCQRVCPQGCIDGGPHEPHAIQADHCLQCGHCFEKCPARCIERLG